MNKIQLKPTVFYTMIHYLSNRLKHCAGKYSLRTIVLMPFLLQFLFATCLIGLLLIHGGQTAVDSVLQELRLGVMQQVHDQLRQRMEEALQLNQLNAHSWLTGILDLSSASKRDRYFVSHLQHLPHAAMAFIGLPDGSFYGARRMSSGEIQVVRNNRETSGASWYYATSELGEALERREVYLHFDPRSRPWYQAAQAAQKPVFSNVYRHFVFGEPTVTAAYPVFKDGQLVGVLGVDYLLSWLGNTLTSLAVGPSGQVFVTDAQGILIAASTREQLNDQPQQQTGLMRAENFIDPVIQSAARLLPPNSEFESAQFKLNEKNYFVGIRPFQEFGIDWRIYVVLADNDFLSGIQNALHRTGIVTVLTIMIVFLLAFWTSGWVTKPIVRLNEAARELAAGRLKLVPDTDRHDELGELSRSFNSMGQDLTDLVSNLETRVAERTLELEERNQELQRLSCLDGLTGLANRRHFDNYLKAAWNQAKSQETPLGILMLDIDYFKNYNDTYGHQAGDDCLRAIGALILNKTQNRDCLAARFGGEEFIIALSQAQAIETASLAEKIRLGVESLAIEHLNSPLQWVTISIGTAWTTPQGDSAQALIAQADQALYQAKQTGRNRVVNAKRLKV